jgi:hypothetical protein
MATDRRPHDLAAAGAGARSVARAGNPSVRPLLEVLEQIAAENLRLRAELAVYRSLEAHASARVYAALTGAAADFELDGGPGVDRVIAQIYGVHDA